MLANRQTTRSQSHAPDIHDSDTMVYNNGVPPSIRKCSGERNTLLVSITYKVWSRDTGFKPQKTDTRAASEQKVVANRVMTIPMNLVGSDRPLSGRGGAGRLDLGAGHLTCKRNPASKHCTWVGELSWLPVEQQGAQGQVHALEVGVGVQKLPHAPQQNQIP